MRYDFDTIIDRRGTFCTQWDYIEDRFGEKDLLPFSISDTDFRAPEAIQDRLREMVDHGIYGYSRWNHDTYKGAVADYFRERHDTEVEKDWVVYSPSVLYSIAVLLRFLSRAGDGILTLQPMYDAFFRVIQDNGRRLEASELIDRDGHYEIDFADFERKAAESTVFLLCSPHNPTGRVWTKAELERMFEICRRYGLTVISDEIRILCWEKSVTGRLFCMGAGVRFIWSARRQRHLIRRGWGAHMRCFPTGSCGRRLFHVCEIGIS